EGCPVTIRFLDPPLHEFVPTEERDIELLAQAQGKSVADIKAIIAGLHEFNPMMGHRGCRLAVTYPEIAEMQTRAVIRAAINVQNRHPDWHMVPEIMIPLVGEVKELKFVKDVVCKTADEELAAAGVKMEYLVGTMIEIPRAAITADEIAKEAQFFSFGTNDLTQMTFGFSRDDAGKFLGAYYDRKIYENDPFAKLDQDGVGKLVKMAAKLGRQTRPDLHLGICGEQGGDPASVEFCHNAGLDYVSCSPFRVPIARLAAAQAAIKAAESKEAKVEEVIDAVADKLNLDGDQVNEKISAAKAVLKDAAAQLQNTANLAADELMDVLSAGFKSLKAGWNEAKKTYGEEKNSK
ncbi:MAG: pyruvate, phosphate dikinase, partial [Oscillospiraceae bacterium]|nr:pyruvate, phosphate dikinase [Oscillospiraceae bacterium]